MHPNARINPLGYTPGTRPCRECTEVSTIAPFHAEAAVLPHCLERLQRIAWAVGRPCELLFSDVGSRDGSAENLVRQAVTRPQIRLERLSRNSGLVLLNSPGSEHGDGLWA